MERRAEGNICNPAVLANSISKKAADDLPEQQPEIKYSQGTRPLPPVLSLSEEDSRSNETMATEERIVRRGLW